MKRKILIGTCMESSSPCSLFVWRIFLYSINSWLPNNFVSFYEACLDAMMLTEPPNCFFLNGCCLRHPPTCMFQIFFLKLAEIIADDGFIQLYGYIAVRDHLDALLNYIVSFTRDDPIIVEKVHTHTYLQFYQGMSLSNSPKYWCSSTWPPQSIKPEIRPLTY
jgi:hypothetical protein